jgi:hypothetical protein
MMNPQIKEQVIFVLDDDNELIHSYSYCTSLLK